MYSFTRVVRYFNSFLQEAPKYKTFADEIARELKEVEKDNSFIYHETVPRLENLSAIKPAVVAKATPHDKRKVLEQTKFQSVL